MLSPRSRRAATGFIFVTVVIDVMAGTMAFPVLPTLIGEVSPDAGAARIAELFGLLASLFFVMQFIASPVQGALSDRFGRRPIILASTFGIAADFVIMALAPNIWWLAAGRVIGGVLAGSITAANAYIVDTTAPEKRATQFGFLFAAMAFGQTVGPAIGGLLASYGTRVPFWAAAAMSLLNALYGLFVLPESLDQQNRTSIAWADLHPIGAALKLVRTYPAFLPWAAAIGIAGFAGIGVNNVWVVYTGYRYAWTPKDIGLLLSIVGIVGIGLQTLLVSRMVKALGERATMLIGFALAAAGFVLSAFAPTGRLFFAAVLIAVLGNIANAPQSSIMSRLVGPQDQGLLSGATNAIRSLTGIFGPVLFTAIFAQSIRIGGAALSGAAFVVAGLLYAASGLLCAWITRAPEAVAAEVDRS
jgi:DHA1 family tetracycline resistance protein-like MFS transporter